MNSPDPLADAAPPPFISFLQSMVVRHSIATIGFQIALLVNTAHKMWLQGWASLTGDNIDILLSCLGQIAALGSSIYILYARTTKPMPQIVPTKAAAQAANTAAASGALEVAQAVAPAAVVVPLPLPEKTA